MFAKTFLQAAATAALLTASFSACAFAPSSTSFKAGVNNDAAIAETLSSIAIRHLTQPKSFNVTEQSAPKAKLDKKHTKFEFLLTGNTTSNKADLLNLAAR